MCNLMAIGYLMNSCFTIIVLILNFSKPFTFLKHLTLMATINHAKIESGNVIVANRFSEITPVATFTLSGNFTFREKNVRYGVSEVTVPIELQMIQSVLRMWKVVNKKINNMHLG